MIDYFQNESFILTEGAVAERLRREFNVKFDPFIEHSGFIYQPKKRNILDKIYREYIDIAYKHNLPILIFTPTRRANKQRVDLTGLQNADINKDNFHFLSQIRESYGDYANKIRIGGIMGCKGDAYKADEALDSEAAEAFHQWQATQLSQAGVDFLFGATLPAYREALGLAKAMASTKTPYILSFIIHPNGLLLDGNSLHSAIEGIDTTVNPKPLGYMVNCTHPTVLNNSLNKFFTTTMKQRLLGLQANTSSKSPDLLNNSTILESDDFDSFIASMRSIHLNYGLKVLGGCCGTNYDHIEEIAKLKGISGHM